MNNLEIKNVNGKLVTDSRLVATMVEKEHAHLMRDIRVYESVISENPNLDSLDFFIPSTYKVEGNNKTYDCFLLTRKGCDMVANKMTGEKGILFTATYVTRFEEMEQQLSGGLPNELSPQLQVLINLELSQKQMQQAIDATNQRVDKISDIVALSTTNWREDAKNLISRVALAWGGYDYIREVNSEIYDQLNARMGVNLKQRQTNKRDRMAREGVCKSTRDKVTLVDVISDDKKLIEGYVAIVKEMAIKHGVGNGDKKGA